MQKGDELMAEDLFIPKLGQTVEEVVLISWLVKDGDKVDFGDPVMEVETDKAIFNVEANAKGTIRMGPYQIGETLPVLTVVATIGKPDEPFSPSGGTHAVDTEVEAGPIEEKVATPQPVEKAVEPISLSREKVFASPRARKLAREKGVDLSQVTPTGGEGLRVVEDDVIDYLEQKPSATPLAAALAKEVGLDLAGLLGTGPKGAVTRSDVEAAIRQKMLAPTSSPVRTPAQAQIHYADLRVEDRIPLKSVRKIIFDRMGASVHTTARVTLFTEADATDLVALRERLKAEKAEAWGFAPGYNELLGMIVARTLPEFPYMNARISQDGSAIEHLAEINLGIAMDTARGLLVPVIKGADQLNLQSFGKEFRQHAAGAQSGQLHPDDLVGGTFTITNLGNLDVDGFTPVINLPEAAILGIGRIQDKVIPVDGEIKIRKMITLSLVFDHRIIDGAPAARFLQKVKYYIEHPCDQLI